MGLNIGAYGKLTPMPGPDLDHEEDWEDNPDCLLLARDIHSATEEHFPGRLAGVAPGIYAYGEHHGFHAGSHSGFNEWRNELARMAGYESAESICDGEPKQGAFIELIDFSDCEGAIGPIVAAKLAKDFAVHKDRAAAFARLLPERASRKWFLDLYEEWKRAFEVAAEGGVLVFR